MAKVNKGVGSKGARKILESTKKEMEKGASKAKGAVNTYVKKKKPK